MIRHIVLVVAALAASLASAVRASALDREAFTFTRYELEVRISPETSAFDARGRIVLRNDSKTPQNAVALQISSSLSWASVQSEGKPLTYVESTYTSDVDHTGALSEAIVSVPAVPPKGTIELTVRYGGAIRLDATRLTRIGVPAGLARRNEWDTIGPSFTGFRGVGYVAWYPVAMEAASLSEGNRVASVLGTWKQRHAASSMQASIEFTGGQLRTSADECTPATQATGLTRQTCTFRSLSTVPTLALGNYETFARPAMRIAYLPLRSDAMQEWAGALERLLPTFVEWFGRQQRPVTVVDMANADMAPFETNNVLFAPLQPMTQRELESMLAHHVAHAFFESPRPWIDEGLAHFLQVLWREKQEGRRTALAHLKAARAPLAQAEKQAAAVSGGQPLVNAADEVFHRSKGMFVWWMLRDMVGEQAVLRALRNYIPAQDKDPTYVQSLIRVQDARDLEWFFDDWVYRDKGLPDFKVATAFSRELLGLGDAQGAYSVTVTVENTGDAGAEVPVIVRTARGEVQQKVEVRGKSKGVVRIQVPAAPVDIVVNDGSVPEAETGNNTYVVTGTK